MGSFPGQLGSTVLAATVLLGACAAPSAPTASPEASVTAEQLMAGIRVSPTVGLASFVATGAFADLGIDQGIRLVKVRVVDGMNLQLRIEAAHTVAFAAPPTLCLVGPYSAPDDAGLQDRCWGEPDVTSMLQQQLAKNDAGQPLLDAGQPIDLMVKLSRGQVRCDYPAGKWVLELKGQPMVRGVAAEPQWAPEAELDVPLPAPDPLPYLKTDQTRYCGLATAVYLDQGEPEILTP